MTKLSSYQKLKAKNKELHQLLYKVYNNIELNMYESIVMSLYNNKLIIPGNKKIMIEFEGTVNE